MWNSEISTGVFLLNRSRNTHDTKSVFRWFVYVLT